MIVATWNVLHKVHSVNWGEPPQCGLEEPARVIAVADRVAALNADVVCLQEVSGDQLQALRGAHVFSMVYPRVPRLKKGTLELSEHLVILSKVPGRVVLEHVFASDPGKGFLAVDLDTGVRVISTHVTWGDKGAAQLAVLASHARGPCFVGGDYNTDADTVLNGLGAGFVITAASNDRYTRPRAEGVSKSQNIDHVVTRDVHVSRVIVEDGLGLSDHNPVVCE